MNFLSHEKGAFLTRELDSDNILDESSSSQPPSCFPFHDLSVSRTEIKRLLHETALQSLAPQKRLLTIFPAEWSQSSGAIWRNDEPTAAFWPRASQ